MKRKKIERNTQRLMTDFWKVEAEFSPDSGIFSVDDARMTRIKTIVRDELSAVDRTIILLYAETASIRETAKVLQVSPSSVNKRIKLIQQKIKEML